MIGKDSCGWERRCHRGHRKMFISLSLPLGFDYLYKHSFQAYYTQGPLLLSPLTQYNEAHYLPNINWLKSHQSPLNTTKHIINETSRHLRRKQERMNILPTIYTPWSHVLRYECVIHMETTCVYLSVDLKSQELLSEFTTTVLSGHISKLKY